MRWFSRDRSAETARDAHGLLELTPAEVDAGPVGVRERRGAGGLWVHARAVPVVRERLVVAAESLELEAPVLSSLAHGPAPGATSQAALP